MDAEHQIAAFADDLDRMVDRYREEFDLTYASVVGVLFMKSQLLCQEAVNQDEESEEEE